MKIKRKGKTKSVWAYIISQDVGMSHRDAEMFRRTAINRPKRLRANYPRQKKALDLLKAKWEKS